jgi:hypothetical protein
MASPRPSLLLAGTLVLALSGCSGTPFGDALSGSFSRPADPVAQPSAPATASPAPATPQATATSPAAPSPAPKTPAAPAGEKPPAAKPAASAKPAAAAKPAPYRVTIRLPEADPSAPAEVVTQALRAAGVPFEVEMIERMPAAGTPAADGAAPASGSAAPATSRPAPAPR